MDIKFGGKVNRQVLCTVLYLRRHIKITCIDGNSSTYHHLQHLVLQNQFHTAKLLKGS